MISSLSRLDVVVVKFPFSSSLKYKARPAVIISNNNYNNSIRDSFIIMAISSQINNKLENENEIINWEKSGLLKPSILKSSIATIQKDHILQKLGKLQDEDVVIIEQFINNILKDD